MRIRVEKRTLQIIGYADAMLVTLEMAYGVAVCVEGDQVLGLCLKATTTPWTTKFCACSPSGLSVRNSGLPLTVKGY